MMPARSTSRARLPALALSLLALVLAGSGIASAEPRSVLLAGDIGFDGPSSGAPLTAALVEARRGVVITAGDNVYPSGTRAEFQTWYQPTWGRFKGRTRPTPGNHDYYTPGAAGYFDYFGWRAGPGRRGYYSFKVGDWRVYALDSEACKTTTGCKAGSPQHTWLKRALARHGARCSLAVWHTPRYSSGEHGSEPAVAPLYRLLFAAGAEIIVNGHDHDYERMAPARPTGRVDRKHGVQQFVVGTGGAPLRARGDGSVAHSRAFQSAAWGVLRLWLRKDSYRWTFVPVDGETYTDTGERRCHGRP